MQDDKSNPETAGFLRISLGRKGSYDLRRNLFRAFSVTQVPFVALVDSLGFVLRCDVSREVEAEARCIRDLQRGRLRQCSNRGEACNCEQLVTPPSAFPWIIIDADKCCSLDLLGIDTPVLPISTAPTALSMWNACCIPRRIWCSTLTNQNQRRHSFIEVRR